MFEERGVQVCRRMGQQSVLCIWAATKLAADVGAKMASTGAEGLAHPAYCMSRVAKHWVDVPRLHGYEYRETVHGICYEGATVTSEWRRCLHRRAKALQVGSLHFGRVVDGMMS